MVNFTVKSNKKVLGKDAIKLVQSFTPIKSSIYLNKNGRKINAKSILGLLSAEIEEGSILHFDIFEDDDASEVMNIIENFFVKEG